MFNCEKAKIKPTNDGGGGRMGGCEPRIEVIVKMQKKSEEVGSGRVRAGGRVRCEPRIEVIVKMQKKSEEGGGGPVGYGRGGGGSGWMWTNN